MIPTEREPVEFLAELAERCYFCNAATRWWHTPTNNPVCPVCASSHKVEDLPKKGEGV